MRSLEQHLVHVEVAAWFEHKTVFDVAGKEAGTEPVGCTCTKCGLGLESFVTSTVPAEVERQKQAIRDKIKDSRVYKVATGKRRTRGSTSGWGVSG